MKLFNKIIFIVCSILLMASCKQEQTGNYLQLSDNTYSFSYDGNDSIEVKVIASAEWLAETEADWLKVTKIDKETMLLKADRNDSKDKRTAEVIVSADGLESRAFKAEQFPVSFDGSIQDFFDSYFNASISRNGKFAAVMRLEYPDPASSAFVGTPYVIDLESGEVVEGLKTTGDFNVIEAVSDDGNSMIYANVIDAKYALVVNGEQFELRLPDGYVNAVPQDMSSDASVVVGYATNTKDGKFHPIRWRNNEPEVLEMPDVDEYERPDMNGTVVRGCSADGSVLYGSEWNTMAGVYWVDTQMHYLASKFLNEGDLVFSGEPIKGFLSKLSDMNGVSHNGKYVAFTFIPEGSESMYGGFPAVVETETGKIYVFDELNGTGITVDDEGKLFVSTPGMSPVSCSVADYKDFSMVTFQEYIKGKFGITVPTNKIVFEVSADGRTYGGASAFEVTPPYVEYKGFYLDFND